MARRSWASSVVGWTVLVAAAAGAEPLGPAGPRPTSVGPYIQKLASPDPALRAWATDRLSGIDPAVVRPAVIDALPTATPDVAGRLLTVLLRTEPWMPPAHVSVIGEVPNFAAAQAEAAARLAFDRYPNLSADDRCARVEGLRGTESSTALIRVLTADPCPAVRWSAANALRQLVDADPDPNHPLAPRIVGLLERPSDPAAYPAPAANGPLLAAAAWAVRWTDRPRADDLMGRALAVERADASAFRGQADFAFLWAADRATSRSDPAAAAGLFRDLAARTAYSAVEVPEAVADLFALHADSGPFPAFADDLRLYQPYLSRPELIYCLSRLAGRALQPVMGRAIATAAESAGDAVAIAVGGASVESHTETVLFLVRHEWADKAGRELQACLLLPGGSQSADLYYARQAVAADRSDDAAAGRYLERALSWSRGSFPMSRVDRYGTRTQWTESEARAEVHWDYLKAAATAGDHAAALAEAEQIMTLDASDHVLDKDPGMAADLVPVLAEAGYRTRADKCFDDAYAKLSETIRARPADAMQRNNLAWLCARSDRKLDEADPMSAEAIRLEPSDAACLDTRAEVLCRLGRPAESLAIEGRALALKPRDLYMQRQLERFRAAALSAGKK